MLSNTLICHSDKTHVIFLNIALNKLTTTKYQIYMSQVKALKIQKHI